MFIYKIFGLPADKQYNAMPFGRQIEHQRAFEAFRATAKSVHFSAKGKSTKKAFREFKALYLPTQWFMVDSDKPGYHDDSFQVWYV
jgi:hypothetical protein